jgi:hypothetical protein
MAEKARFSVGEHIIAPFIGEAAKLGRHVLSLFGISAPAPKESRKAH